MRILYVAQNYQPMSASSITTREILEKLAENGHETTLLAPRRCPAECIPGCSLGCKDGANFLVKRVPTLVPYYLVNRYRRIGALTLSFCHLFLILQALKIGREKGFHVIISQHHPSHLASFSAFVLSRILKVPLIVKTHDVYDSASGVLQSLFLHMLDSVYRLVFKFAEYILVVSSPLRSRMIETYKLEKNKVLVFPNGVNIKEFRPEIEYDSLRRDLQVEDKKIILFVGRIREERGLTLLIRALPKIVAENSHVIVLIVGDGPQRLDLVKLSEQLGMKKYVKFVHSVVHGEIPKYICMSDVTIGPLVSTIDTFGSVPRKVLEYMACAKPVIACQGGVSEDLIIDNYNGFLIHLGNVEELASTVLNAISGSKFVKEVRLNARRHVEKFYDWDRIINVLEKVLHASLRSISSLR